jgi:hypothetical protein
VEEEMMKGKERPESVEREILTEEELTGGRLEEATSQEIV